MRNAIAFAGGDYDPMSDERLRANTEFMVIEFSRMAKEMKAAGIKLYIAADERIWISLALKRPEITALALSYRGSCSAFAATTKQDWALIWNGASQTDLTQTLEAGGCRPVYVELGVLPQRDNYIFDFAGANQRSDLATETQFEQADPILFEKLAGMYCSHLPATPPPPPLVGKLKGRRVVFLPLQVEMDSNIVLHSPYKFMTDFVRAAVRAFPDSWIVARPHPLQQNVAIEVQAENLIVSNEGGLGYWLSASDVICGINSTVLIEALMFLKPVVAVGAGLGSGKKVYCLEGEHALLTEIDTIRAPNISAIQNFVVELIMRRQLALRNLSSIDCLKTHVVFRELLRSSN